MLLEWLYEWVISMTQPSVVRVPAVCGMGPAAARSELHKLGLRAKAVEPDGQRAYLPSLHVAAQEPAPGTAAKRRTVVTMYLALTSGAEYA